VNKRSWIISNSGEWKAMRQEMIKELESSLETGEVYIFSISPWINDGRRFETRKKKDRTILYLDIPCPMGEVVEINGEKNIGNLFSVLEDFKRYYVKHEKRISYLVSVTDIKYTSWSEATVIGRTRNVLVSGTILEYKE